MYASIYIPDFPLEAVVRNEPDLRSLAVAIVEGAPPLCRVVAMNPDAAIHAARGFRGITLIPASEEAERLGSLPVGALAPPPEILETLDRWGVRTFRALAALPTLQLSERLGQEGVRLQKLARGRSNRSLVLCGVPLNFEEVMELEYPVALLEPLAF